jgi:hypothetical protein
MAEYTYEHGAYGELLECDHCHYPARTAMFDDKRLCEICASAVPGGVIRGLWGSQVADVYQTLGWIGNRLLDEIRSTKPGGPQ